MCYLALGILAFVFIAKGKCPGTFFKLGLLVAPIALFISSIRLISQVSISLLNIIRYGIEFLVILLIVLFVVLAIFNVGGKKKLWLILGISLSIAFNLFTLVSYVDIGLDFKEFLTTYIYQSMLVAYSVLYLLLTIKSEGCSCAKCECQKEETK